MSQVTAAFGPDESWGFEPTVAPPRAQPLPAQFSAQSGMNAHAACSSVTHTYHDSSSPAESSAWSPAEAERRVAAAEARAHSAESRAAAAEAAAAASAAHARAMAEDARTRVGALEAEVASLRAALAAATAAVAQSSGGILSSLEPPSPVPALQAEEKLTDTSPGAVDAECSVPEADVCESPAAPVDFNSTLDCPAPFIGPVEAGMAASVALVASSASNEGVGLNGTLIAPSACDDIHQAANSVDLVAPDDDLIAPDEVTTGAEDTFIATAALALEPDSEASATERSVATERAVSPTVAVVKGADATLDGTLLEGTLLNGTVLSIPPAPTLSTSAASVTASLSVTETALVSASQGPGQLDGVFNCGADETQVLGDVTEIAPAAGRYTGMHSMEEDGNEKTIPFATAAPPFSGPAEEGGQPLDDTLFPSFPLAGDVDGGDVSFLLSASVWEPTVIYEHVPVPTRESDCGQPRSPQQGNGDGDGAEFGGGLAEITLPTDFTLIMAAETAAEAARAQAQARALVETQAETQAAAEQSSLEVGQCDVTEVADPQSKYQSQCTREGHASGEMNRTPRTMPIDAPAVASVAPASPAELAPPAAPSTPAAASAPELTVAEAEAVSVAFSTFSTRAPRALFSPASASPASAPQSPVPTGSPVLSLQHLPSALRSVALRACPRVYGGPLSTAVSTAAAAAEGTGGAGALEKSEFSELCRSVLLPLLKKAAAAAAGGRTARAAATAAAAAAAASAAAAAVVASAASNTSTNTGASAGANNSVASPGKETGSVGVRAMTTPPSAMGVGEGRATAARLSITPLALVSSQPRPQPADGHGSQSGPQSLTTPVVLFPIELAPEPLPASVPAVAAHVAKPEELCNTSLEPLPQPAVPPSQEEGHTQEIVRAAFGALCHGNEPLTVPVRAGSIGATAAVERAAVTEGRAPPPVHHSPSVQRTARSGSAQQLQQQQQQQQRRLASPSGSRLRSPSASRSQSSVWAPSPAVGRSSAIAAAAAAATAFAPALAAAAAAATSTTTTPAPFGPAASAGTVSTAAVRRGPARGGRYSEPGPGLVAASRAPAPVPAPAPAPVPAPAPRGISRTRGTSTIGGSQGGSFGGSLPRTGSTVGTASTGATTDAVGAAQRTRAMRASLGAAPHSTAPLSALSPATPGNSSNEVESGPFAGLWGGAPHAPTEEPVGTAALPVRGRRSIFSGLSPEARSARFLSPRRVRVEPELGADSIITHTNESNQ